MQNTKDQEKVWASKLARGEGEAALQAANSADREWQVRRVESLSFKISLPVPPVLVEPSGPFMDNSLPQPSFISFSKGLFEVIYFHTFCNHTKQQRLKRQKCRKYCQKHTVCCVLSILYTSAAFKPVVNETLSAPNREKPLKYILFNLLYWKALWVNNIISVIIHFNIKMEN